MEEDISVTSASGHFPPKKRFENFVGKNFDPRMFFQNYL